VDAADYSVWRSTVGSTTDLRADGSGPTAGVPDGVVDEYDYDFWKLNFGHTAASIAAASLVSGATAGSSSSAATGEGTTTALQPPAVPGDSASPSLAIALTRSDPSATPRRSLAEVTVQRTATRPSAIGATLLRIDATDRALARSRLWARDGVAGRVRLVAKELGGAEGGEAESVVTAADQVFETLGAVL